MKHSPEYRRILARMGYYSYQGGLIFRHESQDGGWDEHNRLSREYILAAAGRLRPEIITVLGSGWLLDFPLAELVPIVKKINLVDIVHPPELYQQASVFGNVEIIEADATGGLIGEVWQKCRGRLLFRKLKNISSIAVPEFVPGFNPGLVVSLNILTQLENLPLEFIRRRASLTGSEADDFRRKVQQSHLDFLLKHRSLLISDVEEVHTYKNGLVKQERTLLADLPEGSDRQEWTWDFDLRGSDFFNSRSVMKVIALTFGT